MRNLTAFQSYDIRGRLNSDMDDDVAYRIGRAIAEQFSAKAVVIGWDARASSPSLAEALSHGVLAAGCDVWSIGLAGTEEMYCATAELNACCGVEITASHNPIDYNGMKLVKSGAKPLEQSLEFPQLKQRAQMAKWVPAKKNGKIINRSAEARDLYIDRVLRFVDLKTFKPLKILVNSGNGAAGPTFNALAKRLDALGVKFKFLHHFGNPDPTFPNGIPNPLILENQRVTSEMLKSADADFGIAFDGDFDRCFFFDENGQFVSGEYIVGLLAEVFLSRQPGSKIVHDPRVIWNIKDIIQKRGGVAVESRTGHAYVKAVMRENLAIYGGEISAHHYFRDFHYCDSGMIPWLLMAEKLSTSGKMLSTLISERRRAFTSSGEYNFMVENADCAIARVIDRFKEGATLDDTDGVSLVFADWRFNLRKSNTEPLVRLNVEARSSSVDIDAKVVEISGILKSV